ncbi:MAG: hypothetical protein NVS2B14_09490 [Chamaesiphon sp.]
MLELLARAANLNLAFIGGTQATAGTQAASTISLDLQNEPVQNVFNYVLQLSGLQANRMGSTIFVGPDLPLGVREIVSRTFRLNQISVGTAAAFLSAQGAATQRVTEQVAVATAGEGANARTTETRTTALQAVTATAPAVSTGATAGTPPLLLAGLSAVTDERLNTITLVGDPRKVQVATSFLIQLDARRRQVAVNVKIVDVNLLNTSNFGTSFSFGVGDSFFALDQGAAVFSFGRTSPPSVNTATGIIPSVTGFPSKFLAALQAQITSGNGKILTDPTLVVQEGDRSRVNLTQEVFGGFTTTYTQIGTIVTPVQTPIIKQAGLIVDIEVPRIDDNGFVTLAINPTVSSVNGTVVTTQGAITLLQQRQLQSGLIRLRDGQTLILSGIIQEADRSTVSKVPILGDIPLLGALFRSTNRVNQRTEVIVLLTPQIISDPARSSFGYNYTPGPDARQILQRQGFPTQGGNK